MRLRGQGEGDPRSRAGGSVLVIVLWITLGLVTITLYFANSMSFELRAADNRVAAVMADQAIDGAARYVEYVLANLGTNGTVPDPLAYQGESLTIGAARCWLIGRPYRIVSRPNQLAFGLVDEASKLNANTAPVALLELLPRMTPELAAAMVDWRDSDNTPGANGAESETYARLRPPYLCKNANFETVDELRLVYGADMAILVGEDGNRNGVLDANEYDENRNSLADPGVLEYLTIYSREPNTRADGSPRINIAGTNQTALASLLATNFTTVRANEILALLGAAPARSPLELYVRSGMKPEEFALIANDLTVTNGPYLDGLVNVNTATAEVLACIPGIGTDLAPDVVSYRQSNLDKLTSVAWVAEVLERRRAVQAGPFLTTRSYQFTADIAAVGPHGRGYRRVRFVFDTSDGTPRIIYRQDLSHLGWALGPDIRQTTLLAQETR